MKKLFLFLFLGLSLFIVGCENVDFDESSKIVVYTRDTNSGTRDGFFTGIEFEDAVKDNTKLKSDAVQVESNGDMITKVKNDINGIGYISLASYNSDDLNGLKFGGVVPTEENVNNGTYKLTRNFNYIVADYSESTNNTEKVKQKLIDAFLVFLTTKEAKTIIKANDGIVTINETDPSWESEKPTISDDLSNITLNVGGSTSVEKIAKKLFETFKESYTGLQVVHNHGGSGDAYKKTQGTEKGTLDVGFASREFKITSSEPAKDNTYGKIAVDAIVVVVNKDNTVITDASKDLLKKIFSGEADTWEDVK